MSGWIPRIAACIGLFLLGIITGYFLVPEQSPAGVEPAEPAANQTVAPPTGTLAADESADDRVTESDFSSVLARLDERIASLDPEPTNDAERIQRLINDHLADAPAAHREEWTEKLRGMSLEDAEFLLEQRHSAFGGASPLIMQTSYESPESTDSSNRSSAEQVKD